MNKNLKENLNPFVGGGIVSRLQYLGLGVVNAILFHLPLELVMREVQKDPTLDWPFFMIVLLLPPLVYTGLVNVFKRVRDIKGQELESSDHWKWGLGSLIPLVNIVVGCRLLFQRGMISSNLVSTK